MTSDYVRQELRAVVSSRNQQQQQQQVGVGPVVRPTQSPLNNSMMNHVGITGNSGNSGGSMTILNNQQQQQLTGGGTSLINSAGAADNGLGFNFDMTTNGECE